MRKTGGGFRSIRLLCLLFGFLTASGSASADCQVRKASSVALIVKDGSIMVPVEVNGATAVFILDTGAQRSLVTEAAVARLGLARDPWVGTTMSGIGGLNSRANADTRSLSLGGVPLVRHTLNHDTSLTVGVLPRAAVAGLVIDGLLGRDYLSMFDLDLDMLAHRLTLYRPIGCAGRFLPWGGGYAAIPVSIPTEHALVLPVVLDGVALRALLDTGASSSLLGAPGMFRLGLEPARLGADQADQVSGLGPRIVTMRRHRFDTLRVGSQTIDRPLIWVGPIRLTPIVDMLLGADWLAGRRVWISYATRQLFMAVP
ncbi:retroviral-like aspartic protease family protein [Rhodopila sp.]|uniref:retroviral-like aspartic protease family protein n=1 Tax=Rhodopila sp. TaxID=2480087 RepID=UPI003D0FDAFE